MKRKNHEVSHFGWKCPNLSKQHRCFIFHKSKSNSYLTAALQLPNCKKKSAAHENGFEVLVLPMCNSKISSSICCKCYDMYQLSYLWLFVTQCKILLTEQKNYTFRRRIKFHTIYSVNVLCGYYCGQIKFSTYQEYCIFSLNKSKFSVSNLKYKKIHKKFALL